MLEGVNKARKLTARKKQCNERALSMWNALLRVPRMLLKLENDLDNETVEGAV